MKNPPVKKLDSTRKADQSSFFGGSLKNYVGELKQEIKRINWTSREELIVYAKIVVAATAALGVAIFCVDLFLKSFVEGLGKAVHWIFG